MQSVLNSLRIFEAVADCQPVGVSELARQLDLPKSTVQRSLRSLAAAGWICASGGEPTRWRLTTRALRIARKAVGELGLRVVALPVMEELNVASEESIHLVVPEGDQVVLIDRLDSPKPVRTFLELGVAVPLHGSANGKAVLAFSPKPFVDRLVETGLDRLTERTITDPDALRAELKLIRDRGYATNHAEWRDDVAAVAAAIVDADGMAVAGISISIPSHRMSHHLELDYGRMVCDAAARISAQLGYR